MDVAGNIFEGTFEHGDAVNGRMSYATGDIYVGDFLNDERHGQGRLLVCETGDCFEGRWCHDDFMGSGNSDKIAGL